ncbi:hypothetical protein SDJN02_14083, partial [Cucurbita argyrosperma subsp. argyrosperma]
MLSGDSHLTEGICCTVINEPAALHKIWFQHPTYQWMIKLFKNCSMLLLGFQGFGLFLDGLSKDIGEFTLESNHVDSIMLALPEK